MTRMGLGNQFSGFRERRNQSRWRIALFVGLFALGGSASGWAQASGEAGPIGDILGPHGDSTRGCEICHVPRLGPQGEAGKPAKKGPEGLWGQIAAPAYGSRVPLESETRVAEMHPDRTASGKQETVGILLCLSCHDGSLTPQNMMQGWSYERQVGLLNKTPFWNAKIPTLLGDAEAPAREHPLGVAARIPTGDGLVWTNGTFSVTPKSPYAQFVANYGAPALMSTNRAAAYGVNSDGEPYALCTTCHDQHVRSVFASDPNHPIAGDGGGKVYTTFFFVNGPYNPTASNLAHQNASSSAQFCRQCHFEDSNERNNVNGVPTLFF